MSKKQEIKGIPGTELLRWYEDMLIQRRFEEKTAQVYREGKFGGFCHLYIGQEAVSTGSMAALRPDDYVITAYRDHGQAISKGSDPKRLMAELYGKVTGISLGKGGSMHFFDKEKNFLGGHGIVGGHIPLATGVGFAIKYRGGDQVCLCFMGDGATNIGAFHESLNLAALWKLPVIYIIENNMYGMGTAVGRASAEKALYKKALAYGKRAVVVNRGQDVFEVHNTIKEAVKLARETSEPSLIEIETYRYRGHSMSDPVHGHYRSKEEVESRKQYDPLTVLSTQLIEAGITTEAMLEELDAKIIKDMEEAVQFAENSPVPPPEDLWKYVYAE